MVRISLDFGSLSITEVVLFTSAGWGLLVPSAGAYFLFKYTARKLDEGEVVRRQSNAERKLGFRPPVKEFATFHLKMARQIRVASYLSASGLLLGLVFNSWILLGILATRSQHVLQSRGVITALWALGVFDFGVLLPAYLCAVMISRGFRTVGEKILLLADRLEGQMTQETQEGPSWRGC